MQVQRISFNDAPVMGRPPSQERVDMLRLQVGESFLLDDERRARHAQGIACKMKPMRFSVLKSREGWRVTRIA